MTHEQLLAENARLAEQNQALATENKLLRGKLDALVRRLFGPKSEQINEAQLLLLPDLEPAAQGRGEAASTASPGTGDSTDGDGDGDGSGGGGRKRPRSKRGEGLPADLPVEETVVVPEEVGRQPGQYREIGRKVTDLLDYEPARYFIRRTVRPVFVRRGSFGDQTPVVAPAEPRVLERGFAAPGLIASMVVSKYCDHLPLYRQEAILGARHGIRISRQNMARWMAEAAFWLKPIYCLVREEVFAGGYVQIDETAIRYLEPGSGKAGTGYLWTAHRPGGDTFFYWEASRAAACLERIVPEAFAGRIQCDGYAAYESFAKTRGRVGLLACMAHIRRKFFEAKEEAPRFCRWLLRQFRLLYRIEARLRRQRAGPALRAATRSSQSAMAYRRIERALVRLRSRYLPGGLMGKAISYALEQWPKMEAWMEDGRCEIDNNLVENAIRPTALGKKNWLFFGRETSGETSAILYTVVECCRRRGLDPFEYLREVLTHLPKSTIQDIAAWTPAAWAAAHAAKARPVQLAA